MNSDEQERIVLGQVQVQVSRIRLKERKQILEDLDKDIQESHRLLEEILHSQATDVELLAHCNELDAIEVVAGTDNPENTL